MVKEVNGGFPESRKRQNDQMVAYAGTERITGNNDYLSVISPTAKKTGIQVNT